MIANIYRKGEMVDTIELPDLEQKNREAENVLVIMRGKKIGKRYEGVIFGRLVVSQLPLNYDLEGTAKIYSSNHAGCFWIQKEDGSFGS